MASITIFPRNLLADATLTVSAGEDTGFPKERLADSAVGLFWTKTTTAAVNITGDFGVSGVLPTDLMVAGHNFSGEDVSWQYSTNDSTYNNAVTTWTQSGNGLITKSQAIVATAKRYWRLAVSSMTNPRCAEVWMSEAATFTVQADPYPQSVDVDNVRWNRTVGGLERSTKFGDPRRSRAYTLRLDSTDLAAFRLAMDDLDGYRLPFYLSDHEGEIFFCRLQEPPAATFFNKEYTEINFKIVEVL